MSALSHKINQTVRHGLLVLATVLGAYTHAQVAIPSVPLQTGATIAPNLFYMLDDSGSMAWESLPDSVTGDFDLVYRSGYDKSDDTVLWFEDSITYTARVNRRDQIVTTSCNVCVLGRSSEINKVYYNPQTTYKPWAKYDGTSFANASTTGAYYLPWDRSNNTPVTSGSNKLDLTTQSTHRNWVVGDFGNATTINSRTDVSYWPVTYYVYKGSGSNTSISNYNRYQYRSGVWYVKNLGSILLPELPALTLPSGRTGAAELQNFANWFTYYRSRMATAKAASSLALAGLGDNFRVGFGTINKLDTTQTTWRAPPTTTVNAFDQNSRKDFYERLFDTEPSGSTPLRRALRTVGTQVETNDNWWLDSAGKKLSCRRNFTILTTDGYWNDSLSDSQKVGNTDGTNGTQIKGTGTAAYQYKAARPYTDSNSDTLADIAMHYWKRDLRTDLDNNIGTTPNNPAFWQHMSTYALSFGLGGNLNPKTDLTALTGGSKSWSSPTSNDAAKLDDLWHATLNSRGAFIGAADPAELVDGLRQTISAITNETSSSSNLSASSTQFSDSSRIFQSLYKSGVWSGNVLAYKISETGVSTSPLWSAAGLTPTPSTRNIYTSTTAGLRVPFAWTSLDSAQQSQVGSSTVLNYLRGDRSQEQSNGTGSLRTRDGWIGDIVNSSPTYLAETETVFVGSNGGMLHAFDANTGVEQFAYVPLGVYSKLKNYTDPAYTHAWMVDGESVVVKKQTATDKHILVSTLGRGGPGLFGLDVSTPAVFNTTNVLWDRSNAALDADMGLILHKPRVANIKGLGWRVVVGNGLNSTNGKAVLYVINPSTGAIDMKINTNSATNNGLSAPTLFDSDDDGLVDTAYAGDQLGQMWKFNLVNGTVALSGSPLIKVKNASGVAQPITSAPLVVRNTTSGDTNNGKVFVIFGTGRLLTATDPTNTDIQTWYGIIDNNTAIADNHRSANLLRAGAISTTTTLTGLAVRTFTAASASAMTGKVGWYIDLAASSVGGSERMLSEQTIVTSKTPVLLASSTIPEGSDCSPGGRGYLNMVDPYTGGAVSYVFLDINNDNVFDDKLPSEYLGSVDFGVGMPSSPVCVGNRCVVSGSQEARLGGGKFYVPPTKTVGKGSRISWREIVR